VRRTLARLPSPTIKAIVDRRVRAVVVATREHWQAIFEELACGTACVTLSIASLASGGKGGA